MSYDGGNIVLNAVLVFRSQQEIQRREVALEASLRECQQLKQQHQQQQRDEEDIKKRASMSQSEHVSLL